jgi:hypothetical protein
MSFAGRVYWAVKVVAYVAADDVDNGVCRHEKTRHERP